METSYTRKSKLILFIAYSILLMDWVSDGWRDRSEYRGRIKGIIFRYHFCSSRTCEYSKRVECQLTSPTSKVGKCFPVGISPGKNWELVGVTGKP